MEHFRLFVLPFWLGAFFLLVTLLYKYIGWFVGLTAAERRLFVRSLFTRSTFRSVGEVISESLLHRKIWRTNKLLGYMHTSFALGWFLLILTGWIETLVYFKGENVPLYVDIFFSYYVHPIFEHNFNFSLIKDALLLLILIGIGLALFKRIRSRMMGMRRTTRHTPGDRIALSALWLIFPARLLAESMTSGVIWKFGGIVWALGEEHHLIPPGVGCGSFLTNSTGELLARILPPEERKKEAVKLEDIVIAVPKKDDSEPEIQRGRVEHFNEGKGYGFIKDLTSGEKYFFHVSSAPAGISEGNTVTFETERSARGMNAINITLTK